MSKLRKAGLLVMLIGAVIATIYVFAYGYLSVWPGTGTPVTEQGTHDIAYDGQGGAVIAWGSGKSTFSSEKSYVQRVSAEGKLLWGEKGIRLNP